MEIKSTTNLSQALEVFKTIPDYQRDFVWGEEQIEEFLNDIDESSTKNIKQDYFMGALVFELKSNTVNPEYHIVDGQQRLTILFLFIAAACHHLRALGAEEKLIFHFESLYLAEPSRQSNGPPLKLKLKPSDKAIHSLFVQLVEEPISSDKMEQNPKSVTANKILAASGLCSNYLVRQFPVQQVKSSLENLYTLFDFIKERLKMTYYVSTNELESLNVYERLNSSGKPLELLEISKGYMFRSLDTNEDDWNQLRIEWDTFQKKLEKAKFTTDSVFLRYFLGWKYKKLLLDLNDKDSNDGSSLGVLPTKTILSFIKKHSANIFAKPFDVVSSLADFTENFIRLREGKDLWDKPSIAVANINTIASTATSQNLMLLNCKSQVVFDFAAKVAERQILINKLLSKYTGTTESRFIKWGLIIYRRQADGATPEEIIRDLGREVKESFRTDLSLIDSAIENVRYAKGSSRSKIILQIAEIQLDEIAGQIYYGGRLDSVAFKKITEDHIIIQENAKIGVDELHSLGNLALLYKTENSARGTLAFDEKKTQDIYNNSNFLTTKGTSARSDISGNSAIMRALSKVTKQDQWDESAIKDRTEYIKTLCISYIDGFLRDRA